MVGGRLQGVARSPPVGEAPGGLLDSSLWRQLHLTGEGEVASDEGLLRGELHRAEPRAVGRGRDEFEVVAGAVARLPREDEAAFAPAEGPVELRRIPPEDELVAGDSRLDSIVGEAVAAVFVDVAADADAETGAAILGEALRLEETDGHREGTLRIAKGAGQGMDAALARADEAFGPAVADAPVLHRVGPAFAAEEDTVFGAVPAFETVGAGGLRDRFAAEREAEDGEGGEELEAEAAGEAADHGGIQENG